MTTDRAVAEYLTCLRGSLKTLPDPEREEVLSEIAAHIRDSLEQGLTVEQILSQLGPAKDLGAEYSKLRWAAVASEARSPWSMLRSVLRLARTGAVGAACFLIALFGYVSGVALITTALLKPFFPRQIGFWVGPDVFGFGFHNAGQAGGGVGLIMLTGSPAHEVLGRWYIPVTCLLGGFLIWATTNVVRRLAKRVKTKKTRSAIWMECPKPIGFR